MVFLCRNLTWHHILLTNITQLTCNMATWTYKKTETWSNISRNSEHTISLEKNSNPSLSINVMLIPPVYEMSITIIIYMSFFHPLVSFFFLFFFFFFILVKRSYVSFGFWCKSKYKNIHTMYKTMKGLFPSKPN
jgi:hypothetical protein